MKLFKLLLVSGLLLLASCQIKGKEEKAIEQMVETFVNSIRLGDETLAMSCLLDQSAYEDLNPSAAARADAENYTQDVIADLVYQFRELRSRWEGKDVELKSFRLGNPFYQYKPRQAFQNNFAIVEVDGAEFKMWIEGIVMIQQKWRIVTFSGRVE